METETSTVETMDKTVIETQTIQLMAKLILLMVSALSLNGCLWVSSRVSEVGLREYVGTSKGLGNQTITFAIYDVETDDPPAHPTKITYRPRWPYVNHGRGSRLGEVTGTLIGDSAITYQEPQSRFIAFSHVPFSAQGTVDVDVEGAIMTFEYQKRGNPQALTASDTPDYNLRTRTSEWYRYPSQVLLPATVVIDVGLDVLMLPLLVFVMIAAG